MSTFQATEAAEPLRRLVSHELSVRRLHVVSITRLTARLVRVTLGGEQLDGFRTLAPDDHIKLLFPEIGKSEPVLPQVANGRVLWPGGDLQPIARDYTPARFDAAARELDLELVAHAGGHATAWLEHAGPGSILGVAGPRGSYQFTRTPSPLLLAGDETALPAMARFLRELPSEARAHVFIEVNDARDELPLASAASAYVHWLHRGRAEPGTTTLLLDAVRASTLPVLTFAFLAGEAGAVQALRRHLCDERGVAKEAIGARGYWKRGVEDHQEPHDD
jgi:NADPH-dependent ferric siderophore reductase